MLLDSGGDTETSTVTLHAEEQAGGVHRRKRAVPIGKTREQIQFFVSLAVAFSSNFTCMNRYTTRSDSDTDQYRL